MNFKQTRTSLGYTQASIAPLLGLSLRTVQAYEAKPGAPNHRTPSRSVLMLLEKLPKMGGV